VKKTAASAAQFP